MVPYIITAQVDLLGICNTPQNAEVPTDNVAPVDHFRAPGLISTIDCTGELIGVGCADADGVVLQLLSRLLVDTKARVLGSGLLQLARSDIT